MSVEDNKTLVRQYYEQVVNGMKLDRIGDFASADFIYHVQGTGPALTGLGSLKQGMAALLTTLPDAQTVIEDLTAEGDKVVVQLRYEGTFQGRRVSLPGVTTYRIQDGKLAERWGEVDFSPLTSAVKTDLSSSRLGPPPRTLTPQMEAYAAHSGWQTNTWVLVVLGTVFTGCGLIVLFAVMPAVAGSEGAGSETVFWFVFGLFWIGLTPAYLGIFRFFQWNRKRKVKFVLENGQVLKAAISSNQTNWSYKVNGAPQRIVTMELAGKPFTLKTFNYSLADELPTGATIEILYHEKYPKTIIPTSRLTS